MVVMLIFVFNIFFNDGLVYVYVSGDIMYIVLQGGEIMGGYDIFML